MKFRITILCENSVGSISGTLGEHGFSALIEPSSGEPLLFDTGQGLTLLHNAQRMNKNLSAVRNVIISHGHYDHTGGLLPLLHECGPKEVYGHTGIFMPRYRIRDVGDWLPIGIPHERTLLESFGAIFHLSDSFREVAPDIFVTGQIPRAKTETADKGLFSDLEGRHADGIIDDQSLILRTDKGLVILLGCCHAGLANTLEHIAATMGMPPIHAIIGGTHLSFCGSEQVEQAVVALKKIGVHKLAVSHCTGFSAAARLYREFPKAFHLAMVGYCIEC